MPAVVVPSTAPARAGRSAAEASYALYRRRLDAATAWRRDHALDPQRDALWRTFCDFAKWGARTEHVLQRRAVAAALHSAERAVPFPPDPAP